MSWLTLSSFSRDGEPRHKRIARKCLIGGCFGTEVIQVRYSQPLCPVTTGLPGVSPVLPPSRHLHLRAVTAYSLVCPLSQTVSSTRLGMVSLASSTGEQAELMLEAWALVQAPRSQLSWPSSRDCTAETRQGPWPSRGTGRWG